MKILLISSQFPPTPGGGGVYTYYLSEALLSVRTAGGNRRNEICILTSGDGKPETQRLAPNLELHLARFSRDGGVPYESVVNYGLALCRTFQPDVIHGQHFEGTYVAAQLKAAFPEASLLATFHQSPSGESVEGLERRDAKVSALIALVRHADKVVVTCNLYERELHGFGVSVEKLKMIWPGVNRSSLSGFGRGRRTLALERLKSLRINSYDHVILCPARLDPSKDLETFVRAAGALKKRANGKVRFVFLVAGKSDNPTEDERRYQAQLEEIARTEAVYEDLRFTSFEVKDMFAVYKLSSACVLSSVREALGLVLIEAMALRVPVVATNVRGITDVIEPELNALDFPPRDHQKLSEQLHRVISELGLADRLRDMGVGTVTAKFQQRRMGREHYMLYKSMARAQ